MEASTGYAVAIGEALVDLIEDRDHTSLRPMPGGSPLNVAVGAARLGTQVEFFGSFGRDGFARRLREFLTANGVGINGSIECEVPTSLAVTTFDGAEPSFAFYGTPPSYGLLQTRHLDMSLLNSAMVVHAGSIGLLESPMYSAAMSAFSVEGPVRTLDPNVRLSMIDDLEAFRDSMETLFRMVDVVKLSIQDARALYQGRAGVVAEQIARFGPRVVIVTLGGGGLLATVDGSTLRIPGRIVDAIDTTGAGDACMAAVIAEIVRRGWPADTKAWEAVLKFAVDVSACTCCAPGGATAMPTRQDVIERFASSRSYQGGG